MKNLLICIFLIFIVFCISEISLRYSGKQLPLETTINYNPIVTKSGYNLNSASGVVQSSDQMNIQYHYYPFHLRDTPINQLSKHILVLGDSFTFGWMLPWDNTFIHHFQVEADKTFGKNKYQFLNAGTPGWGTADQLKYLEDFGASISPKYVLIFINTDDIGRSIWRDIYKLPDSASILLLEKYRPIKTLSRSIFYNNWLYKHSVLLQVIHAFLYQKYQSFYNIKPRKNNSILMSNDLVLQNKFAVRYGEDIFIKMNKWCKEHNTKLIVVTTGFNAFYPPDIYDPTKDFLSSAKDFFEKENIPYYDISFDFKKSVKGKEFQINEDVHPNAFGTKMIAQIGWPWIRQQIQ